MAKSRHLSVQIYLSKFRTISFNKFYIYLFIVFFFNIVHLHLSPSPIRDLSLSSTSSSSSIFPPPTSVFPAPK